MAAELWLPVMDNAAIATPVPLTPAHDRRAERQPLDPRLLERPEKLPKDAGAWRFWKLRASGWLGCVDARYKLLLIEAS